MEKNSPTKKYDIKKNGKAYKRAIQLGKLLIYKLLLTESTIGSKPQR